MPEPTEGRVPVNRLQQEQGSLRSLASLGARVADSPKAGGGRIGCRNNHGHRYSRRRAEVILGQQGVIHAARKGLVVIDMSTISPKVTRTISAKLSEAGAEMLRRTSQRRRQGGPRGTLTIMVGGAEEAFNDCLPILQAMGKKIVRMGESGSGAADEARKPDTRRGQHDGGL